MIESVRHKGLQFLFKHDEGRKLKVDQLDRIRVLLSARNSAETVEDMNQPTFRLHPLKGDRKGWRAVTVRANWRVTFRFTQGRAYDVDLEDYH